MLKIILILLTIHAINSALSNNLTQNIPLDTNSCTARQTPGLICESCDRMALCVKLNGQWQTYPVEPCDTDNGLFCNIQEGKCSNSSGPCNRLGYEANFACTSDGIFPDPYDCQKYHMCYHAQSQQKYHLPIAGTAKCDGDNAYSVATSDCSAKIIDSVCKVKQYECHYPGDNNSWPGNSNIFYICQPDIRDGQYFLYPTLYRCAPHEIYDGYNCVINENELTKSTKLPTSSLSTTKRYNTDTTINNSENFSCKINGIGIRSDPNDCHAYYYCSSQYGAAKHYMCPHKTFFNINTSACTFGECV